MQQPQSIQYHLNYHANECELALVSIDEYGTPGILNKKVLNAYGYNFNDLNPKELSKGYAFLQKENRKAILFVVTVGSGATAENLTSNLYNAIEHNLRILQNKNVWVPLMGTGDGNLTLIESFTITLDVLSRFVEGIIYHISIPKSAEGEKLFDKIPEITSLEVQLDEVQFDTEFSKKSSKKDNDPEGFNEDLSLKKGSSNKTIGKGVNLEKEEIIITTIAGLISDADSGIDYLDITKDVNAFAKVMSAKSFSPPLAIALLGKWGSGKSFFMRKLKERIQELSQNEVSHNAYCNGIAHVHFNAWSYMDSNLWAGIITKIFEGLQEYITNDTLASVNKKEIEKALTKKLNISQDEILDLEHQKQSINNKIKTLESQKGIAEKTLKEKIDAIKSKSIKQVLNNLDASFMISEKVSNALQANDSFKKSTDKFSKIVPEEYWQDPTKLYKKTKSKVAYVKTFFKGASWESNLLWLSSIIILIILIKGVIFLMGLFLGETSFEIPTKAWYFVTIVGGFIFRNYQTVKQLQPLISTFWKIKEDYELQKKDAIFKVNQAEKALKFEIDNHKTKIETINNQISQAEQSKLEIEYRLENTLTTEALFSFIEKRSVSDDYKKHLGIVSVIRKDFEILSELFSGHHDELIKSKESEEFQKKFNKPLERIILYIDDLDRCSDDRVVQVLEAVNLLMAYPLFVVVVGVDPRWVKNALTKKYKLQFSNGDSQEVETIEPSGYLEKIFQVPFQLKSASNDSVKHMLKTLAESQPKTLESDNKKSREGAINITGNNKKGTEKGKNEPSNENPISIKETIESLKFSDKEIEILQTMSHILGTNPRAIKRFVNIYRVIKAHEDFKYAKDIEEGEISVVMFLIALPLGKYRKLVKDFEKWLYESNTEYADLSTFTSEKNDDLRYSLMKMFDSNNSQLLTQRKEIYRKHYYFVKRFTFSNL